MIVLYNLQVFFYYSDVSTSLKVRYHGICENLHFPACEILYIFPPGFLHQFPRSPMAAPPVVFPFIGIVFTAILYGKLSNNIQFRWQVNVTVIRFCLIGLYCAIFALYWKIQLKRAYRRKSLPFYALSVNFILCSMYFIISTIQVQFDINVSHIKSYIPAQMSCMSWLPIWTSESFDWFLNPQEAVLKNEVDSLDNVVNWMNIPINSLYTAIDFISQLILVSILNIYFFLINVFFKALPVLGHVGPTIGYGYPVHFITCVFRCYSSNITWFQTNFES